MKHKMGPCVEFLIIAHALITPTECDTHQYGAGWGEITIGEAVSGGAAAP